MMVKWSYSWFLAELIHSLEFQDCMYHCWYITSTLQYRGSNCISYLKIKSFIILNLIMYRSSTFFRFKLTLYYNVSICSRGDHSVLFKSFFNWKILRAYYNLKITCLINTLYKLHFSRKKLKILGFWQINLLFFTQKYE